MNIESTEFEYIHESSEVKNSIDGEYIYHNITVWNTITVNGKPIVMTYQAGHTYRFGDCSSPSNELSLYESDFSDIDELNNNMTESAFDEESSAEYVSEMVAKFSWAGVKNKSDLFELYTAINDNLSQAEQYRLHEIGLSAEVSDYDLSEFDNRFKYVG
jgi:hypothetical protein